MCHLLTFSRDSAQEAGGIILFWLQVRAFGAKGNGAYMKVVRLPVPSAEECIRCSFWCWEWDCWSLWMVRVGSFLNTTPGITSHHILCAIRTVHLTTHPSTLAAWLGGVKSLPDCISSTEFLHRDCSTRVHLSSKFWSSLLCLVAALMTGQLPNICFEII